MKLISRFLLLIILVSVIGCESMNRGGKVVGEGFGKATKVGDSVSEGALDGYMGADNKDNPYNR